MYILRFKVFLTKEVIFLTLEHYQQPVLDSVYSIFETFTVVVNNLRKNTSSYSTDKYVRIKMMSPHCLIVHESQDVFLQKQLLLWNSSQKIHKIHRKALAIVSVFSIFVGQQTSIFSKIRVPSQVFLLVNFANLLE